MYYGGRNKHVLQDNHIFQDPNQTHPSFPIRGLFSLAASSSNPTTTPLGERSAVVDEDS